MPTRHTIYSNSASRSWYLDCCVLQSNCKVWFSSITVCRGGGGKGRGEIVQITLPSAESNLVDPIRVGQVVFACGQPVLQRRGQFFKFSAPFFVQKTTIDDNRSSLISPPPSPASSYRTLYLLSFWANSISLAFKTVVISQILSAYSLFFLTASMSSLWSAL